MAWKVVRRILALFIRIFIWHPVIGFVVVILALGGIGYAVGGLSPVDALNNRTTTGTSGSQSIAIAPLTAQSAQSAAPVPSVDEYIKGMTTFDAKLEWDSFDQVAITTITTQGGTQESLQATLSEAKQRGAHYQDVTFIGGYPKKNGEKFLFYVVTRQGFSSVSPDAIDQVFFVFTVGPSGKIVKIE